MTYPETRGSGESDLGGCLSCLLLLGLVALLSYLWATFGVFS